MSEPNPASLQSPAWVPTQGAHADDETIELYVRGQLDEERTTVFEDHYALCRHCQQRITECQEFVSTVRTALAGAALPHSEPAAPPFLDRLSNWFRGAAPVWAPAFAALVLVVAGASLWTPGLPSRSYAEFTLEARRGPESPPVPAHQSLRLILDRTGLPVVRSGTLVDSTGVQVLQQSWKSEDPAVLVIDRGLAPGRYWIRLYETVTTQADSPPAREFGLEVR